MKVKIIGVLVGILMLGSASSAFAVGPVLQETRERMQETRTQIREQIQDKREDMRATVSAKRQEFRSDIAKLHGDRLNNRFGFYSRRLQTVLSKLQTRIDDFKEEGKDVTAAQAKLDEAKLKLAEANKFAEEAITKFRSIDPAKYTEQRSVALGARDLANQARESFVATVKLMRECVQLLKALK